jgi:hypothetical protein
MRSFLPSPRKLLMLSTHPIVIFVHLQYQTAGRRTITSKQGPRPRQIIVCSVVCKTISELECTILTTLFLLVQKTPTIICRSKDQGGLGVIDLELQNECLLNKWIFNLINSDGAWKQLLRNKYMQSKAFTHVKRKPGDSQFCRDLMNVRDEFLSMGNLILQDGKQIRFWEDMWDASTLKDKYHNLYNILREKSATIADIFIPRPLNVSFIRNLAC